MNGHLLLVHWDAVEAATLADQLRTKGFDVTVESEDGGRAARRVQDEHVEALVVSLDHRPSHGRETARALREHRATRDLPMVFFGGEPATVADLRRVVPDATHVPWVAVPTVVDGILRHRHQSGGD